MHRECSSTPPSTRKHLVSLVSVQYQVLEDSSPGRCLSARGRAFTRTRTILNCGAPWGAAKSCALAVRVVSSCALEDAMSRAVRIAVRRGREHRGLIAPSEKRSVVGGTHRKIRARCAIQFGAKSGPCALLCTVAKRSMEASWRAESRQTSPRLGSQGTSAWLTVDRNVCAPVPHGVCERARAGRTCGVVARLVV